VSAICEIFVPILIRKFRQFFDACDGIFLNYVWKEKNLDKSLEVAGVRALDVFVGVDIFGRNCFGGGGYNTNAVKLFENLWFHILITE
jgi:Glycosyl hydrolase family 85